MSKSFNELKYEAESFKLFELKKKKKEEEEFHLANSSKKKETFAQKFDFIINILKKVFGFLKIFQIEANSGKDMMTSDEIEHYQGKTIDDLDFVIALQDELGIESNLLPEKIKIGLRGKYKNLLSSLKDKPDSDVMYEKINFILGKLTKAYVSSTDNEDEALEETSKVMQRVNILLKNKITEDLKKNNFTESEKKLQNDLLERLKKIKYKKFDNEEVYELHEELSHSQAILNGYKQFIDNKEQFKLKLENAKQLAADELARKDGINLKDAKKLAEDIRKDMRILNDLMMRVQKGEDVTEEIARLKAKAELIVKHHLPGYEFENDAELGNLVLKVLDDKEICLKQYQNKVDTEKIAEQMDMQYEQELTHIRQKFRA